MADLGTVVGLVSPATALVASVTGPLVALHVGRTQVRAAVLSANRQRWIDTFRELMAEFCFRPASLLAWLGQHRRPGRAAGAGRASGTRARDLGLAGLDGKCRVPGCDQGGPRETASCTAAPIPDAVPMPSGAEAASLVRFRHGPRCSGRLAGRQRVAQRPMHRRLIPAFAARGPGPCGPGGHRPADGIAIAGTSH